MVPQELAPYILSMSDAIPFEDQSFDIVVSNTVLEHVKDLDMVFAEIARVLRPNGRSLHIFPHLECWREGHCEIPFLHRFPSGRVRTYYAAAWRTLGFGTHHKGKSVMQWSRDFCVWLDDWTFYRPLSEINETASTHFEKVSYIEPQWLETRIPRTKIIPEFLQRLIVRKMAGIVMITNGRRLESG
jgi:ubiquinone/menaquinone biosynthesis C-methylase UbiE